MDVGSLLYGLTFGVIAGVVLTIYGLFKTDIMSNYIYSQVQESITQLPAMFKSDPALIDSILAPIFQRLQGSMGAGRTGSTKIGDFRIPNELLAVGLSIAENMFGVKGSKNVTGVAAGALKDLLNP